jgi:hypothetical protein
MEIHTPHGSSLNDIVLIGPLACGKTSLALDLSEGLHIPNYPMDRIKWYYRFRNGYDIAKGTRILREKGFRHLLEYSYPYFSIGDIRVFLEDFKGGIIDFGGSQSYYPDDVNMSKAREIFAPFRNVVLILPSPDEDECIRILSQRIRNRYNPLERTDRVVESYIAMNREFIVHPSNRILSKFVVYTEGKTVRNAADEILELTGWAAKAHYPRPLEPQNELEWRNLPNFGLNP